MGNAELELGGPRAFPAIVCIACVAELELGVPRAFPVIFFVALESKDPKKIFEIKEDV